MVPIPAAAGFRTALPDASGSRRHPIFRRCRNRSGALGRYAPMRPALWWQTGIIYQVYPRSFQDSGGDGVGDLPGIIRRLPHLTELGVDAVWLSPIYPSPMADFG